MKQNPVIKNIMERESCRKFKKNPLSQEDIDTIVTAGTYAPSAGGRQPWQIAVVTNPEIIQLISDESAIGMAKALANETDATRHKGNFTSMPVLGGEYLAPLLIMIFEPKERTQDAASHLAAENMMLAAWSLGIASCWLGAVNATVIQKNLEDPQGSPLIQQLLPDGCHLVCTLAFGYADEAGFRHPRLERRKDNVRYFQ